MAYQKVFRGERVCIAYPDGRFYLTSVAFKSVKKNAGL
jgi:hypothetical protein